KRAMCTFLFKLLNKVMM
ncbi:peptidase MA superfamily protein, partial [Vibrio parahaemolyticus IDH02640]